MKKKTLKAEIYFAGNIKREKDEDGGGRTVTGLAIVFGERSLPQWADEDEVAYEVIDEGAVDENTIKNSDILLTMFHDRERLLGRSRNGEGTMKVGVDKKGVSFSCEMPDTTNGNDALVSIDRGDITGCSFIGMAAYDDIEKVTLPDPDEAGRTVREYHIRKISDLKDFTITPSPAYPATGTEIKRELEEAVAASGKVHDPDDPSPEEGLDMVEERLKIERERKSKEQVEEMRQETSEPYGWRPFGYEW